MAVRGRRGWVRTLLVQHFACDVRSVFHTGAGRSAKGEAIAIGADDDVRLLVAGRARVADLPSDAVQMTAEDVFAPD